MDLTWDNLERVLEQLWINEATASPMGAGTREDGIGEVCAVLSEIFDPDIRENDTANSAVNVLKLRSSLESNRELVRLARSGQPLRDCVGVKAR